MSDTTETVALADAIEGVRADPRQGLLAPAAAGELLDGVRCRIAARNHQMTMDEPSRLGATGVGPDPVELGGVPVEREPQVSAAA